MQLTSLGDPLAPGRQVGKYQVVRRLASGGMAEIYLARATGLEGFRKEVVLKRMLPQFASKPEFVRQFLEEARLAATLDHPNIATIFDIDQADGIYFLAMEYLQGEDLGVLLWALEETKRPFPLEHALTIAAGIAAGLHHAHEKRGPDGQTLGIVHRDVSPSNVVITYEGGVKLVDFGIAKATARAGATATGAVKGKLAYMSPEQGNGARVDRRSDVFAVGAVLYEMTTGSRVFVGDGDADVLRAVMKGDVTPPSAIRPGYPPELEAIVMRALRRNPDERYASARDLQLAIEQLARKQGLGLSPTALGAWMEETLKGSFTAFGAPPAAATPEHQSTRVMSSSEVANALEGKPVGRTDGVTVNESTLDRLPVVTSQRPLNETMIVPPAPPLGATSVQRQSRGTIVAIVAGVGAMLTAGVAVVLALRPVPVPVAASAAPAAVVVVAEKGQVAVEGAAVAQAEQGGTGAAEAPAPALTPSPTPEPAPAEPPAPVSGRRKRAGSSPTLARAKPDKFSVIFARRERDLARCYADASDPGLAEAQLFVRFSADRDGRVQSAEVLPTELAGTKLGQCVAAVARSTEFGAQPEPVAFRIPVRVRRRVDAPSEP